MDKYLYRAPDGTVYGVTPQYVYLASDGQYYPAQGSVESDASGSWFLQDGNKVPVEVQYVYTDKTGGLCAAPANMVAMTTAAEPVRQPAAGYNAPSYEATPVAAAAYAAPTYGAPAADAVPASYAAPASYAYAAAPAVAAAAATVQAPPAADYSAPGAGRVKPAGYAAPEAQGSEKIKTTGTSASRFVSTCNKAGGAMWIYMLISVIVSTVVMIFWMGADTFFNALSAGDTEEVVDFVTQAMQHALWPATLLAGLTAGLVSALVLAKFNNIKPFSVYGKAQHVKGLNIPAYVISLGGVGAWVFIYAFLCQLIPGLAPGSSGEGTGMPTEPFYLACYCFYSVIIAPFIEEFIFRGVMFKSLSRYGVVFAAIANAALFGLLHRNFQQMPFAFAVGIVFSYCTLRTGSIWLSTALHFGVNFIGTGFGVLETFLPDHADAIDSAMVALYGLFAVAGIITLIVVAAKHKICWTNENPDRCHCLLPYEWSEEKLGEQLLLEDGTYAANKRVKVKGLRFVLAFFVLTFILSCLLECVLQTGFGVDFLSDFLENVMPQAADSVVIF